MENSKFPLSQPTNKAGLTFHYVPVTNLKVNPNNPRRHTEDQMSDLKESMCRFGIVDPFVVNDYPERKDFLIGGHMRLAAAKELGITTVPVVYVTISDPAKEAELGIRLNKNTGEFDLELLAEFDESILADIGFSSEQLDEIFPMEERPEVFDLELELAKLDINQVTIQKGDIFSLGDSRAMCGDSMSEQDILRLMNGEKADACVTDQPYILDYLKGKKRHGQATEGFGFKRDRRYLETESLPDNFMELWMTNIHKVQKEDFAILSFENWKNLKDMWVVVEKYWKIRNIIIWHCGNRTQGFAAKWRFFSKYDIAVVGSSGQVSLNDEPEEELLQNDYEAAVFATSGKPHWESYEKGKKICPTDVVTFKTDDEKSSGQGVIFGCKPLEVLLPYIKVLTRRNDLIIEPFGGSFSTLIAATKLKRRCYLMEKVPAYMHVGIKRWERLTGQKAIQVNK